MKVAILTSGGLAPCLSSAVGHLIETYTRVSPETEIICYLNGYRGVLLGEYIEVDECIRQQARKLQQLGGSPIGNSRVRLKNTKDCVKRGLVKEGQSPRDVACKQLIKDGITILHTIGGDDTNMSAGDLSAYLKTHYNDYKLTVVGLPKTIDNDVYPVSQTLGCQTAAEEGANFFSNVVHECSANPRMLIIHEIMGRNSGWLAAKTTLIYNEMNKKKSSLMMDREKTAVHALYIPEATFDIDEEIARLRKVMDKYGSVNIFLSEGSCSDVIIKQKEENGEEIQRDAFGHVRLDTLNPGKWFSEVFAEKIGAEKVLVQKSGYFCRSSPANNFDQILVKNCAEKAVEFAMAGKTGLSGLDEENNDEIRCIDYTRVGGGKPFDMEVKWFKNLLKEMGQNLQSKNLKHEGQFEKYSPTEKTMITDSESRRLGTRMVTISTASLVSVDNEEMKDIEIMLKKSGVEKEEMTKLSEILFSLITSFKTVSKSLKHSEFDFGENTFKHLAIQVFEEGLQNIKSASGVTFGDFQTKAVKFGHKNAKYYITLEPVDYNLKIYANVSIGTIFGIYKCNGDEENSFLKGGRSLVASGYCLYGAATIMMLTAGKGTYSFTLDSVNNRFKLAKNPVKIPEEGDFYSVNEAYHNQWKKGTAAFVNNLKAEEKRLRYVGTLVADVHRTILYGGVFMYPSNTKTPEGKLRLSMQLNPISLLIEQAGGKAVDESGVYLLDKKVPSGVATSPVVLGSAKQVDHFISEFKA